ncbi:cytochrome c biogenesis CcdA family protein [Sulfurospirillum sp. 1307]
MENILIDYIQQYGFVSLFASLIVGVITSLAPCSIVTLPLLTGSAITLSEDLSPKEKKKFIYKFSFLFVFGLIISFSILMLLVSKVGLMLSVAPIWAYILASLATLLVAFYALGYFGSIDKQKVTDKFIKFKLYGAIIIGLIFGLVSSPCATAPLIAIITVAENSGWIYSYLLVLAFAIGHASLLLLAGISIGFAQNIASSALLNKISKFVNVFFIVTLFIISGYFAYKAYLLF